MERAAPERADDTASRTSARAVSGRLLRDDIGSDAVDDLELVQQRILRLEVALGASLHSLCATALSFILFVDHVAGAPSSQNFFLPNFRFAKPHKHATKPRFISGDDSKKVKAVI